MYGFTYYATKKDHNIYLHVLDWPAEGRPCAVTIARGDFIKGELLDGKLSGLNITSAMASDHTTLMINRPAKVDPYATVIKLTFQGAVAPAN